MASKKPKPVRCWAYTTLVPSAWSVSSSHTARDLDGAVHGWWIPDETMRELRALRRLRKAVDEHEAEWKLRRLSGEAKP